MRRSSRWAAVLVAASVAVLAVASGDEAAADEAADARFFDRLARRDFEHDRYEAALEWFLLSQRAAPNPRTVFNVAVTAELAERPGMALTHYVEYLALAPRDDPERRRRAETAVERLRRELSVVVVRTDPPGATIYLQRKTLGAVGRSPRLVPVEPGEQVVIAELADHRDAMATVTVAAGGEAVVELRLEPLTAELRVTAWPEGLPVVASRDGEEVARGAAPLTRELPVGLYRVRLDAPGYEGDATNVTVEEGAIARAHLVARPRGRQAGRLLVSTEPVSGAEVRIDGRWAGRTPLTVPRARAGRRRLEVRAPGFQAWTGSAPGMGAPARPGSPRWGRR